MREVPRSQVIVLRQDVNNLIEWVTPRLKTLGADIGEISQFVFGDELFGRLRIQSRAVPDVENLRSLSRNANLDSYPALRAAIKGILRSYAAYRKSSGNSKIAGTPVPLILSEHLKTALRGHYAHPPIAIKAFLDDLRLTGSPDICPMCGSLGTER